MMQNNKFIQTIWLLLLISANNFFATDISESCDQLDVNLYGEGSFLAGPIYANAATGYSVSRKSTLNLNFNYNRTNSMSGLNKLLKRNTNFNSNGSENVLTFAASELPLTMEQQLQYPELLVIPVVAVPLAIVFKLPTITALSFTTQSIVDIYMGKITMWNDPVLKKLNPEIFLPNKTILPVARMDTASGETFVFTSALSAISPQWNATYGSFTDPQFEGGECCESRKWPLNVISYFGNTASGVVGIVSSIPYTIGYTTVYSADLAQAASASIYNKAGHLTEPSFYSTQAAIQLTNTQLRDGKNLTSIFFNVNNAGFEDAYPFVTLSYIIINRTTSPFVSCCAMEELLGFIMYIFSRNTDHLNEQYSIVPLPDAFEDHVMTDMFPVITCQGNSVYLQYLASLRKMDPFYRWKNAIMIICITFGIVIIVAGFAYLLKYRRSKRLKYLAWFVKCDELDRITEMPVEMEFIDENGQTINSSRSLPHSSQGSFQERILTVIKGNGEKYKAFWNRNGNDIVLTKLQSVKNVTWPKMTHQLLTRFIKEFQHENLAYFYGVTEILDSPYLIRQFFSKGTLHRCLRQSEYDITLEMKFCIAKNVIDGLKYLHKKHIALGFLNSLSCFVDANWTVKIGDWQCLTIFKLLNPNGINDMINTKRTTLDSDKTLIELLYLDPQLASYTRQQQVYRSDIYSFGNLLIEIFTKNLPYFSQVDRGIISYQSLFDAKFGQNVDVRRLSTFDDDIPNNVHTLISHCLIDNFKRPDVVWVQSEVKQLFNVCSNKGMIDIVMSSMEKCIEDRTSELKEMTKRLEGILYEVLPRQIACKLLLGETVQPEYFDSCTIFFSDIVGFTTISARSSPMEVMTFLNEIWTVFDKVLEQFDVYKVDTIGDAYMVASGVPNRNGMLHCKNVADFALSLAIKIKNFTSQHLPNEDLKIRMGINSDAINREGLFVSGPVTAGIVGSKMPQYCIFGDTVNTSSRMESTSLPGKIQISLNTKELLSRYFPEYLMEVRGNVQIKGKGRMKTFWLINRNNDS